MPSLPKLALFAALTSLVLSQCSTEVFDRCQFDISEFQTKTCDSPSVTVNATWLNKCMGYAKAIDCAPIGCLSNSTIKAFQDDAMNGKNSWCAAANLTGLPIPVTGPWVPKQPDPVTMAAPPAASTAPVVVGAVKNDGGKVVSAFFAGVVGMVGAFLL